MKLIKLFLISISPLLLAFVFSGCQSTPCNIQDRTIESADVKAIDAKVVALKKDSTMKNIKVYKPDGSLQCNQGKPISLKEMEDLCNRFEIDLYDMANKEETKYKI